MPDGQRGPHRTFTGRHGECTRRLADRAPPTPNPSGSSGEPTMLRLAVLFLVVALMAALFGFGMVADMSYTAAKILFFVFLVLAILALLGGSLRRPAV